MNPAGVTCNSKVFLSQITGKAMQSAGGPFPVSLLFLSSPFFEQSCVQITLPWNKENCKVIGMKRFGTWPCSELTNPHPVFHCSYNNTGKLHSEHTPATSPQGCPADRGTQKVTPGTHKHSKVPRSSKCFAANDFLGGCHHSDHSQILPDQHLESWQGWPMPTLCCRYPDLCLRETREAMASSLLLS